MSTSAEITEDSRVPGNYKKGDTVSIDGYVNEGGQIMAVCILWEKYKLVLVPYEHLKIIP
jgi:hypothetical protein